MSVFGGDYSAYYDLFYADKDYRAEADFVRAVIERNAPGARVLLELGCGSARHAVEFVRSGFTVTGIDRSSEMIARGEQRRGALAPELQNRLSLLQGDAASYKPAGRYDAVVSLFHVVCYQTTEHGLNSVFQVARSALRAGGVFVFDFWHGPAVLAQGPEIRERHISTAVADITRKAEPTHHPDRNVVDVKYTLTSVDRKSGSAQQNVEVHSVRYLFLPEISAVAAKNGFALVESGQWLTEKPLDQNCWSGYVTLKAIEDVIAAAP